MPTLNKLLLSASLVTLACATDDASADADEAHDGQYDEGVAAPGKADTNGFEDRGFEATCILRLANKADFATLDDDAGIWSVAAQKIVDARNGADGELGTDDDALFDTLEQLDDVDWVGYLAFSAMSDYARETDLCPGLGEEYEAAGEDEAADLIIARIGDRMRKEYEAGEDPSNRGLHAKGRCFSADFEVDNAALPEALRVGLFAQSQSYSAWIRFSNGNPQVQADGSGDVRGMAIKLMGVPGEKLLETERDAQTHDFLLNHTPTIPTGDVFDFAAVIDLSSDGDNPILAFLDWNPFDISFSKIRQLIEAITKEIVNPLSTTYWSQVPYRLGGDSSAVKYRATPCEGFPLGPELDDDDPEYFSASMRAQLEAGDACFEFGVQPQLDPESMPIEDGSIEWSDSASPFIQVAKLTVTAQDFESDEQRETCEHLSFTPWHALPEHRPLGNLNRARKRAYDAISERRHSFNGVQRNEPRD